VKLVYHKCEACGEKFPIPEGDDPKCSICGRVLCEECFLGRSGILDENRIDVCGTCLGREKK
jgi:hypothetical protein